MSVQSATRALVDEFRSRPTLRAGSLIVTVFGDAIAPRGGTVWIGSLIKIMADFGISERLVRTSVFRLTRDGWLAVRQVGRRSDYSLTEDGARQFSQATQRIYGEPRQSWSGEWCLVLLAAVDAEQKDIVRKELSWQGFGALSSSVLAHPSPDIAELDAILKRLDVGRQLVVMNARTLGVRDQDAMRELAHKGWNLQAIDSQYAQFVSRFSPVFAALRKNQAIDPRLAFQIRTLLIQEYRKVLLRDPLMPMELLPGDWHGTAAYQLCRNLYGAVFRSADEFLSAHLETAQGPLPPPAPSFLERFGGLQQA